MQRSSRPDRAFSAASDAREIRRVSGIAERSVSQTTPVISKQSTVVASARVRLGLLPVAAITAATVAPPMEIGKVSGTATS